MALGSVTAFSMAMHPTYMWVVPMFHCNGWGNPYTLTALAGTSVCLRYVSAKNLFDAIADHKVTHFGGAPIVLNFIAQAKLMLLPPEPHRLQPPLKQFNKWALM